MDNMVCFDSSGCVNILPGSGHFGMEQSTLMLHHPRSQATPKLLYTLEKINLLHLGNFQENNTWTECMGKI